MSELRLRVLASLPPSHQQYLFEEIRKRCSRFLRHRGVRESEVSIEELLSEVWAKLIGSVSIQDERSMPSFVETTDDPQAPDRDVRVTWLIEQIGGVEAMSHRLEDIFRQRHGRHKPDIGRRLVQANGEEDSTDNDNVAEAPIEIEDDIPLIWIGLVKLAKASFPPEDDVSMLLQLFEHSPGLFDEAPNGQWPINGFCNAQRNTIQPCARVSCGGLAATVAMSAGAIITGPSKRQPVSHHSHCARDRKP